MNDVMPLLAFFLQLLRLELPFFHDVRLHVRARARLKFKLRD